MPILVRKQRNTKIATQNFGQFDPESNLRFRIIFVYPDFGSVWLEFRVSLILKFAWYNRTFLLINSDPVIYFVDDYVGW